MGKDKVFNSGLGRALIKSKNKKDLSVNVYFEEHGALPVEVNAKKKLESKTEQDAMGDFLYEAELLQKKFEGVKDQTIIVKDSLLIYKNKNDELARRETREKILEKVKYLRLPRKPDWKGKTPEQQKKDENVSFVNWRRELASLEEHFKEIVLTPFEKNLDVWKQLWHVIERSHIVVQIVDCRDPFFFRCEDLENYVKEVSESKVNFLVLNKADLIPQEVKEIMSKDLNSKGIQHIFFSAKDEQEKIDTDQETVESSIELNTSRTLSRIELTKLFESFPKPDDAKRLIVGMVGYPNVGKSSLINTLCGKKKVGVDSKPGKTKNMQTIILSDSLMLCDCPGLVLPSIVSSKAEMTCNGVLPIHNIVEYLNAVMYVLREVPIEIIRRVYKLPEIIIDAEVSASNARELLQIYSATRGYHTGSGVPDEAKAAKIILKDYVEGRIPHFRLPINFKDEEQAIYKRLIDMYEEVKQSMPLKNTKKEDLISETKHFAYKDLQNEYGVLAQEKTEEEDYINNLTEQDILDLLEGKKVMGKKLSKPQKREIKFAIKGHNDPAEMLLMLHAFLFNRPQTARLKKLIQDKVMNN